MSQEKEDDLAFTALLTAHVAMQSHCEKLGIEVDDLSEDEVDAFIEQSLTVLNRRL